METMKMQTGSVDQVEYIRRALAAEIDSQTVERASLETLYGREKAESVPNRRKVSVNVANYEPAHAN